MSGKFIVLLMLIVAGGLGCWAFFGGGISSNAASSPVVSKPSPAGAPVPAVQPSAPAPAMTAPVTAATTGRTPAVPADSSDGDGASAFVAMRLDATHVYVALTNAAAGTDEIDITKEERSLTKLGDGAKFGPGPIVQANNELLNKYQEQFERVHVGEEWELELSPESHARAVVTAPVIIQAGCVAGPGFVAQIASADQPSFTAAGKEYFLSHKAQAAVAVVADPKSGRIGELADWKATPEFSAAIEKLLKERMQQELAKIREQDVQEFERFDPKGRPWPKIDDKLAHGEGKLDYDTRAFQLTPDGVPRVYVRARWTIDGKAAFMMGAWVKADAIPSIEAVDSSAASLMRLYEMRNQEVGLERFPKILNVFDPQRDHHAELLLYSSGYEGFNIRLFRYDNAGPVGTNTMVGGGC